jgi:SEFIR domain/NB-ARC domain
MSDVVGEAGRAARPTRVFISYAHESDAHGEVVRAFWAFLRKCGIEATLDVTAAEQRQDWPLWMAEQVRAADYVLVVASAAYRERAEGRSASDAGRGVQWEARLIRDAYYSDQYAMDRFVPVVLPGQSVEGVPDFLAPHSSTVYYVKDFTVAHAEPLLRLLTGQPGWIEPPLGVVPVLEQHSLAGSHVTAQPKVRSPAPPIGFVGRHEDVAVLLTALRDPQIPLIAVKGMGGMGKTALAEEAVRMVAAEALFSTIFWHSTQAEKFVGDGVVRTEVAEYSFEALLDDLLRHSQLTWSPDAPTAVKEKIVGDWLADNDNRVLIVLDNLETVRDRDALVAKLMAILGWGKILVTSRYSVLRARAFTLDLEGLSPDDAITFLQRTAERQNNRNLMSAGPGLLARIRDAAGRAPLAMQLTSGQMDYQPVEQVLRVIEEAGFNDLSYEFYSFLFQRTWGELDGAARKVLVAMRHFDGPPTAGAIQATAGMTDNEFYPAIAKLGQRSMLAMTTGSETRYSLHPLTKNFINTDIVSRWG